MRPDRRTYFAVLTDRWLARTAGSRFDPAQVRVVEFPKAGGTWLARMLSTSTGLPFFDRPLTPPTGACVMRHHWTPDKRQKPLVYLVRDGRETMVSLFYHRVRNQAAEPRTRRFFVDHLGAPLEESLIADQLGPFIELEFAHPGRGANVTWEQHVSRGLELGASGDALVSTYENLLADPAGELIRIHEGCGLAPLSRSHADAVAIVHGRKFTRERAALESASKSTPRPAHLPGAREVFDLDIENMFWRHAGEAMERAGYRRWFV